MRKKENSKQRKNKIVFAVLIGFAVVSFWRGTWLLFDIYLFPDNLLASSISSMAIGLIILFYNHKLIKELT